MSITATSAQRAALRRVATGCLVGILSLAVAGCRFLQTGNPDVLRPTGAETLHVVDGCVGRCTDSTDIVATGVSGFLIVPWRDSTRLVLTAPSFTNPTLWWMAFGDLPFGTAPDSARISRRLRDMPAANADRLSRVEAVLVGHGHYDHLMDLPPLIPRMPRAQVYGSATIANLLNPVTALASRRVVVDTVAGRNAQHSGTSYSIGSAVRIRAIGWAHAPNIGRFTIAPGEQDTPRRTLPRTVHGWKMGAVYAYTVDVIDDNGSVGLRLFFHDAAAGPDVQRRAGEVIATMPAARMTVAILTTANFDQPALYPEILLAHLAPAHVILGHWEDFFRSSEQSERVVRGITVAKLVRRLEPYVAHRWNAPRAGAVTRVRW